MKRPWGVRKLQPWFADSPDDNIGEVWFETAASPLLIKFLFTSENLSVQVHPGDDYAREHHQCRGKTEMWHILRARPDAKIALGFKRPVSERELRDSAESGGIVKLLKWRPARAGDTFFAPAGTVHAIGAGLTLCEVQQHSDITYRLFDYDRGRELHLDHGVKVADRGVRNGGVRSRNLGPGYRRLVSCEHFTTDLLELRGEHVDEDAQEHFWICLEGEGEIAGERFKPGETFFIPASAEPLELRSEGARLLKAAGNQ